MKCPLCGLAEHCSCSKERLQKRIAELEYRYKYLNKYRKVLENEIKLMEKNDVGSSK